MNVNTLHRPAELRLPDDVLEEARRLALPLEIRDFFFEESTDHLDKPLVRGKIVIDDDTNTGREMLRNMPRVDSYLTRKIWELFDMPSLFYIRSYKTLHY